MLRYFLVLISLGLLAGHSNAQEREWTLDASDQDAYLIFGVPETDDVGVSLWCPIHKGTVNLFVPEPTARLEKFKHRKVAMTVTAGKEHATFAAKADINPEAPSSSVEVEIPAAHPLVKALSGADRFSVKVDNDEIVFPFYGADFESLMELCRKG